MAARPWLRNPTPCLSAPGGAGESDGAIPVHWKVPLEDAAERNWEC